MEEEENLKSNVGDDSVTESDKFSSREWFGHAVRPLAFAVNPDKLKCVVSIGAVISKEVMCNANMSCEFRRRVVVS